MLPRLTRCGRPLLNGKRALHSARLDYTPGGRSSVSGAIVTVFGCTGFLGRYVTNALGSTGSQVVIPFRGEERSYNHLKVMGDLGQIVPVRWDCRDKDSIRRAVEHSNVVINCVGRRYDTRNFTMQEVHVDAARNIAEVAKEFGVARFIHVSALACENGESDWCKTKWEGEQTVRSICPEATIIRPATLWGAQDEFMRNHASMMRYWPFYALYNAQQQLQPAYVKDVADALVATLRLPDGFGSTFEFAGPTTTTNKGYAEWVRKALKTPEKHIIPISDNMLWHLGYWLGQHRRPRMTLDTIKENHNVVIKKNSPHRGFAQCGVTNPVRLDSSTALMYMSPWRKPSRQTDITTDNAEIPELPDLAHYLEIHGHSPY